MPDEPKCPQNAPYVKQEPPGEKWWCACGHSQKQPYCDGSHAGTGIKPMRVLLEKEGKVAWCGCKKTAKAPYCDGSHSRL